MTNPATVFLVDDNAAVRDSLTFLIKTSGLPVQSFPNAEAFIAAYDPNGAGCLVLDMNMPGMSGADLQAELNRRRISLPILFLTAYGDIPTTVKTIQAGAIDFLTKPADPDLLLDRIQTALQHAAEQRERQEVAIQAKAKVASLTPRELDVARLLVTGLANKEVARQLDISPRTVEVHRKRALDKTHSGNLIELARLLQGQNAAHHPDSERCSDESEPTT